MQEENQNEKSLSSIEVSKTRKEFLNKNNNRIETNISYKKKNKKNWPKFIIFSGILISIFIFTSIFFHKADIEITQKKEPIIFSNKIYLASVEDNKSQVEDINTDNLLAEGKIKIFNNTSKKMKLRKNTRFQTGDLVFKTYVPVEIAANGTIMVDVYAIETGEKYLVKKNTEFNIPGFKEAKMTNEYNNIYGRSEKDFVLKAKNEINTKATQLDNNPENLLVVRYQIFNATAIDQKSISSIGVEDVSEKATGKIKIVNGTSKTQKLVKSTRFENNGLIFRINKSATILPKSSIIVSATADKAGGTYNITKNIRFSIPGFKEAKMTNEYNNIYGESETNFTGGKIAKENVPNKNELETAKAELTKKLESALDKQIREFIFDKSLLIKFDKKNIEYTFENISKDNDVVVKGTAVEKIAFIPKEDFIKSTLKSNEITEEDLKNIEVKDIHKLEVKAINPENIDLNSNSSFKISVNGNIEIVWKFNEKLFKDLIKGKGPNLYTEQVKNSFPKLEKTVFKVFPFWRKSIPENEDKINIIINK